MKLRRGFVSNSSTSSFTCDVCGDTYTGWDDQYNVATYTCVNGHDVCEHCTDDFNKIVGEDILGQGADEAWEILRSFDTKYYGIEDKITEEEFKEDPEYYHDEILEHFLEDEIPPLLCPVCSFTEASESDTCTYLQKKYSVTREEVFEEVKKHNRRRKKLYNHEYIAYVCKEHNINIVDLLPKLKEEFGTYDRFAEWLGS